MNTTDLRTLLTAPTVSRATFFAYYLGTAKDLTEAPGADPQSPASPVASPAAPAGTGPAQAEASR